MLAAPSENISDRHTRQDAPDRNREGFANVIMCVHEVFIAETVKQLVMATDHEQPAIRPHVSDSETQTKKRNLPTLFCELLRCDAIALTALCTQRQTPRARHTAPL